MTDNSSSRFNFRNENYTATTTTTTTATTTTAAATAATTTTTAKAWDMVLPISRLLSGHARL